MHLKAVAGLALVAFIGAGESAVCPDTGEAAPAVATLMAASTNPEKDAWIVYPNCTVELFSLDADGKLVVRNTALDRVNSLPTQSYNFRFFDTPLRHGGDFSNAKNLDSLSLSYIAADRLDIFVWAPNLTLLTILCWPRCDIDTFSDITFPESLVYLSIATTKISSFDGAHLPRGLKIINFEDNQFTTLSGINFQSLERISFSQNPITTLSGVRFPSSMIVFECSECPLLRVHGVKWPKNLTSVNFYDVKVLSFEIRESDLPAFMGLHQFGVDRFLQTSCEEPTANLTAIPISPDKGICVITDERFDELYTVTPPPVTKKPEPSLSPSASSSGSREDGSGSDATADSPDVGEETAKNKTPSSSRLKPTSIAPSSIHSNEASSSGSSEFVEPEANLKTVLPGPKPSYPSNIGSQNPNDSPKDDKAHHLKASSNKNIVLVGLLLGIVVAIIIIHLLILAAKRRKNTLMERDQNTTGDSPTGLIDPSESGYSQFEIIAQFFRDEHNLTGYLIDHHAVKFQTRMARQRSGVMYRGSFLGRHVAIRLMLPGAWCDESVLTSFMGKIRVYARLQHPKIATFIGITFTNIRQLAAVSEYMDGGDLETLIHKYPESTGHEWFDTWTPSQLPCKARMAADVAEAVVYLHSFDAPILHCDLRAKSVLLDASGNCKLSDFGISGDVDVVTRITGEKATLAWIAPEVLRGEQYDEKADIYSFGVMLVELDRCGHPFSNDPAFVLAEPSVVEWNFRMSWLLGSGQLRPSPSQTCPEAVSALIRRCVSFGPSDRPTAMEIFYGLRKAQRSSQA